MPKKKKPNQSPSDLASDSSEVKKQKQKKAKLEPEAPQTEATTDKKGIENLKQGRKEEEEPEPAKEGPEKPTKKRRYRKRSKNPDVGEMLTVEACTGLWQGIFGILASRLGYHWLLTKQESEGLGKSSKAVLDRYLPDVFAEHQELIALAICLTGAVLPRVLQSLSVRQGEKPQVLPVEPAESSGNGEVGK